MIEDIQNYSPTVIFCGTLCINIGIHDRDDIKDCLQSCIALLINEKSYRRQFTKMADHILEIPRFCQH